MTKLYAIVTTDYYYDSDSYRTEYEKFSEYDYDDFVIAINDLVRSAKRFRAFRITPVAVTTSVHIDITG
jgi:hypothetical protein